MGIKMSLEHHMATAGNNHPLWNTHTHAYSCTHLLLFLKLIIHLKLTQILNLVIKRKYVFTPLRSFIKEKSWKIKKFSSWEPVNMSPHSQYCQSM